MTLQNLQVFEDFRGIKVEYQNFTLAISDKIFYAIVIMICLLCLFIILGNKIKQADPTNPSESTIILLGLLIYKNIHSFIEGIIGKKNVDKYLPVLGSLFIYLLVVNWSGIFGLGEAIGTTSTSLTFAYSFGIIVFAIYIAIKKNGVVNYLNGFLKPYPFFLPLNLMEVFTKPLSMGIRIFANLTSGIIIAIVLKFLISNGVNDLVQTIITQFQQLIAMDGSTQIASKIGEIAGITTNIALTPFLNAYFDLFAGFIQALIFTMLSAVAIAEAAE